MCALNVWQKLFTRLIKFTAPHLFTIFCWWRRTQTHTLHIRFGLNRKCFFCVFCHAAVIVAIAAAMLATTIGICYLRCDMFIFGMWILSVYRINSIFNSFTHSFHSLNFQFEYYVRASANEKEIQWACLRFTLFPSRCSTRSFLLLMLIFSLAIVLFDIRLLFSIIIIPFDKKINDFFFQPAMYGWIDVCVCTVLFVCLIYNTQHIYFCGLCYVWICRNSNWKRTNLHYLPS